MKVVILIVILFFAEITVQNDTGRSLTSNNEDNVHAIMIETTSRNVDDYSTKWSNKLKDTTDNSEEYSFNKAYEYFEQTNVLYNHHYRNTEDKIKHFKYFNENLKIIIMMDKLIKNATFKINEFTGINLDEFTDKHTGFNISLDDLDESGAVHFSGKEAPDEIDWRYKGLDVVRHQGGCKNSYVFSALGNIEMQYARKYKEPPPKLSLEQAFNCEPSGNCKSGGLPHLVMKALMLTAGVMTNRNQDKSVHRDHVKIKSTCQVDETKLVVKITSVIRLNIDKEEDLAAALDVYGPLSTAIYVSHSVKNYHSGILNPIDCKEKANHAVLLVGYGRTNDGIPYWIIKNSWGVNWGESGYMRLIRGKGACNIGKYVATVTIEQYRQKSTSEYHSSTTEKIEPSETSPSPRASTTITEQSATTSTTSKLPEKETKLPQRSHSSEFEGNSTDVNVEELATTTERAVSNIRAVTNEQPVNKERSPGLRTTEKENQSIEKPRIIIIDSNQDSSDG